MYIVALEGKGQALHAAQTHTADIKTVMCDGNAWRKSDFFPTKMWFQGTKITRHTQEKTDSTKRCKTQSHTEMKNPVSQSLSLCHVYYCYLNASANEKNNYGNKDFSKGFQTLFLKLSYLPQHPNAFPLKSAARHRLCRLCKPGATSPLLKPELKRSLETSVSCIYGSAGGFGGESRAQGTARSTELQEYRFLHGFLEEQTNHASVC